MNGTETIQQVLKQKVHIGLFVCSHPQIQP